MASNNLLQELSNPTNDVAQAYNERTQQMDTKRNEEEAKTLASQQQRDNDFHKVAQYAADGLVDEARYFAQQKGLQVPEAVFTNAIFSRGLSLAGSIYADDSEKAQIFTNAFMGAQGDLNARMAAGIKVAGKPISASDKDYFNYVRKEQWKLKNNPADGSGGDKSFSLSAGQTRYDGSGRIVATAPQEPNNRGEYEAFQKAYNSLLGGGMGGETAVADAIRAGEAAAAQYRVFNNPNRAQNLSTGLVQPAQAPTPQARSPEALSQEVIYEAQNLLARGYTPQRISEILMQNGVAPDEVENVLNASGAN